MPTILYVLNLLGYLTGGATGWLALLIALGMVINTQEPIDKAHYKYQIWTHLYILGSIIILGVTFGIAETSSNGGGNEGSKIYELFGLIIIVSIALFCFFRISNDTRIIQMYKR